MNERWETVARQVAALHRLEFREILKAAPSKDKKALLRARFRHRVDEFAEAVVRPLIERSSQWTPLSDFHRAVLTPPADYRSRSGIGLDLLLAPRGVSKTTSTKIRALHAALYGYEAGLAVIAASYREAAAWTDTVRTWASEPEVQHLYGSIPVEGTQTDLRINGVPVWARGWTSSIRGLNRSGVRPTWIILDDIESERNTATESSRDDTQRRLAGAVVPLGPTQGGHRVTWLATPAHHDAVAARVLRAETGLTSWAYHRYPAVIRWPDQDDVWEQARSLYLDVSGGLSPEERWQRVLEYLVDHPEALEGAQTIDPHRLPIQECYRRRWDVGELAWAREYDVLPTVPGEGLFDPEKWPRFTLDGDYIRCDGRRYPWRQLRLAAAWDPSDGGDDGGFALLGRDTTGRHHLLESKLLPVKASQQVVEVVRLAKTWGLREVLVESQQLASLLRDALEREAREQGVSVSWVPVTQHRNKETRLAALEAPAANGLLAVRQDVPAAHLRQFADFNPAQRDNRDDLIDAVEMAYTHLGSKIGWGQRMIA